MSSKSDFSKKIIKKLAEKPAISVPELKEQETKYAVSRALKGLEEGGFIEYFSSGQQDYARLTKEGKKRALSIKLGAEDGLVSTKWDGFWRIVLLDLPEDRKAEREALRYLLKKAGFVCVKNSVWVSMYPFEHLFTNIKDDMGFTTELMIIVTNKLDSKTEEAFFNLF